MRRAMLVVVVAAITAAMMVTIAAHAIAQPPPEAKTEGTEAHPAICHAKAAEIESYAC